MTEAKAISLPTFVMKKGGDQKILKDASTNTILSSIINSSIGASNEDANVKKVDSRRTSKDSLASRATTGKCLSNDIEQLIN